MGVEAHSFRSNGICKITFSFKPRHVLKPDHLMINLPRKYKIFTVDSKKNAYPCTCRLDFKTAIIHKCISGITVKAAYRIGLVIYPILCV